MIMKTKICRLVLACLTLSLAAGCVDQKRPPAAEPARAAQVGDDPRPMAHPTSPIPTPEAPTATPLASPTPTSTSMPTQTPLPVVTDTPSPAPTEPAATPEPLPERIRFAPGGTVATVNGTVPPGVAHRYVLWARKGQTLMVDIAAAQPLLLSVWGSDGTVLKQAASGMDHWESVLPASQDYVLQLAATDSAVDYHMTVTIPSLPEPTPAPNLYVSDVYGFEVRYPPDFAEGADCPTQGIIDDPVVAFRLVDDAFYAGTNLLDACVAVDVVTSDTGPVSMEACTASKSPQETSQGQQEINGLLFSIFSRGGVAAGHHHDVISYRAFHAGACYEITLLLHASSPGVYAPGTITEFDRDGVMRKLCDVLCNFRLRLG
jgi:hypothetical protein